MTPDIVAANLRRGRGGGTLAVLELPRDVAAELVYACVLDDPRIDRQVESRAMYYAELMHELALGIDPIVERMRTVVARVELGTITDERGGERLMRSIDDSDRSLPTGVLVELAVRGHDDALDALHEQAVSGRGAPGVFSELAFADTRNDRTLVDRKLVRRIVEHQGEDVVGWVEDVGLADWSRYVAWHPALAEACAEARGPASSPKPLGVTPAMSTEQLLTAVAEGAECEETIRILVERRDEASVRRLIAAARPSGPRYDRASRAALSALANQGSDVPLAEAEAFLASDAARERSVGWRRQGWLHYIRELAGPDLLPRARRWVECEWPLSLAGWSVLEAHASEADRGMLERVAEEAFRTEEYYGLSSALQGLAVIANPASRRLVETVFREVDYSYARRRALAALVAIGDAASTPLIEEALWDCEALSREIACLHADWTRPTSVERVRQLAESDWEEGGVREAAERRWRRESGARSS